jgi:hypothetical protein
MRGGFGCADANTLIHYGKFSRNWDEEDELDEVIDPPAKYVNALQNADTYPHLPNVAGLVRQPCLRPDGSLLLSPGLDTVSGLYGTFSPQDYSGVPAAPTRPQAQAALQALQALLAEFAFASPADHAATLGAIVTATIRQSLPAAPLLHIGAASYASGKTYLAQLIACFAGPGAPLVLSYPASDDDCQKLLLASLASAPASLLFDNLVTDLQPFKAMCAALTSEHITERVLPKWRKTPTAKPWATSCAPGASNLAAPPPRWATPSAKPAPPCARPWPRSPGTAPQPKPLTCAAWANTWPASAAASCKACALTTAAAPLHHNAGR